MSSWPFLSILIWLPIIAGVLCLCTGNDKNANTARTIALIGSLISVLICIPMYVGFDINNYHMQFRETHNWITAYGIHYDLGVDGIAFPFVMLTTLTTLIVVLSSWRTIRTNVAQYMAVVMILQGMMVGVFAARDAILFYVFWEAMLIPMYLAIGVWGSENRSYASIKFFLYTFLGSALMLVALLYLHFKTNSFDISAYYPHLDGKLHLSFSAEVWIFFAFLVAFAVKVPMWPVHTWLPDAHTEAPAGGSVVLAALMLKMGIYGFLRFNMPVTPDACQSLYWVMIILSLVAVVYIGLVAIAQTDMKRLIAYSSVAHMGFASLGCFLVYEIIHVTGNHHDAYLALEGGMVQMISHAFSTGAMFMGIGILYDKVHSRLFKDYGGVAHKMPIFAALFMLFAMSNVGLPGTSGFVGEFMIILSSFQASFWVAFLASTTLIISACYTLWMYKRVFFGKVANDKIDSLKDIGPFYWLPFGMLAFLVLFLGVYPEFLLRLFHASIGHLLYLSVPHW